MLLFPITDNQILTSAFLKNTGIEKAYFEMRNFPDGETYVRVDSDVRDRKIIILANLHRPDDKILELYFLCRLLRDLGSGHITMIVPYLPYMRQDKRFKEGEAITSDYFSSFISSFTDRIITIDPHLHRRTTLTSIYGKEATVLHTSELISEWIKNNVAKPLIIGPDSESYQWVSEVAEKSGAEYLVLEKIRKGDKNVSISVPDVKKYAEHNPVLVDDIVSTAGTMIGTVTHLKNAGMQKAVCIAVHPVFSGNSYEELMNAGAGKIISCNTIVHPTNEIDVSELILKCI